MRLPNNLKLLAITFNIIPSSSSKTDFQTTPTYEVGMVSGSGSHLPNACKPVPRLQKVQLYSFTLQTSSSCVKVVVRSTVGEEYTCAFHY